MKTADAVQRQRSLALYADDAGLSLVDSSTKERLYGFLAQSPAQRGWVLLFLSLTQPRSSSFSVLGDFTFVYSKVYQICACKIFF